MDSDGKIEFDLDRDRIRAILTEAYKAAQETLGVAFHIPSEEFVASVEPYLKSNRVSIPVMLSLPSDHYPGLQIEVNLRRCKVFARIPSHRRNHPKQVQLNRYLKAL
jgi:hypothetical protein